MPGLPQDLEFWARWSGLGVGVVALALVIWEIRRFRGRLPFSLREKLLALVGVVLLPGLTLTVAQGVAHERMKRTEFCRSCHTMEPFAADLADPQSVTLASRHVRNHRVDPAHACSVCHSTYAMLGPAKDKIRGLRHLYAFYFHKGKDDLALYEPYRNATCLTCHGGADSFERREEHRAVREQLTSEETSCLSCHDQGAHPAVARRRP